MELKSEDASSGSGWREAALTQEFMFHRRSPGNPFDCSLDSVGGLISGGPHGFFWFMASFLLSLLTLFGLSFCIPISVLLSLLLCVALWSLKILENEEPATTAGWDSLWARLDPSPSCPFLSDGQLQAWLCLYIPATSGVHQNKPPHCQRTGTEANVDLVFSNGLNNKMQSFSCFYQSFTVMSKVFTAQARLLSWGLQFWHICRKHALNRHICPCTICIFSSSTAYVRHL